MENQPIYCFKLDTETRKISRMVITDYEVTRTGRRTYYRFRNNKKSSYKYCDITKFNKFAYNQVYLLEDNMELAKKIMLEETNRRFEILNKQILDMDNLIKIILEN